MKPSLAWTLLGGLASALAVWATLEWGIGEGMVEYHASFLLVGVLGVVSWPFLKRRRIASVGLAVTGLTAILTGFWLLYWKDELKAGGWKDVAKFWHSVASVAMLPFFAAHYVRNWPRLKEFGGRLARARVAGPAYVGAWVGVASFGAASWFPGWRGRFTEQNYIPLLAWVWLFVLAAAYFAWVVRRMARGRQAASIQERNGRRALVDWTLFGSFVLATLTGFVLLYLKAFLHENGYKYVSKFWHSTTSIVFTLVIVLHVGANVWLLLAHARRLRSDLDG